MVRRGYDAVSRRYRADDDAPAEYASWFAGLCSRLGARAYVLDLGCGCGVPLAGDLSAAGHEVVGVDFSAVQVERVWRLAPEARFVCADVLEVELAEASFDAVVCLYVLIHLPQDEQVALLRRIGCWLRPGGWLLATAGHRASTGTEEDWLGSGAPMWWSHPDAATNRRRIEDAGMVVVEQGFVAEGDGGHAVFWARR